MQSGYFSRILFLRKRGPIFNLRACYFSQQFLYFSTEICINTLKGPLKKKPSPTSIVVFPTRCIADVYYEHWIQDTWFQQDTAHQKLASGKGVIETCSEVPVTFISSQVVWRISLTPELVTPCRPELYPLDFLWDSY